MIGKTLGHYEIREPLGSGGMGDVYRAHDTSLDRDVAIKVLPEDFADDPDRLARLKREARLLAALNHPNVATIHGFEESDGTRFLVMELVKGESLEQRLAGGALPVDEALGICRQIAEALEAAHEEGIIHRDLKPANVLITPEGRAKVLDFGLAKTVERADHDTDMTQSPTITIAGTEAGVILGTAPYMSPEQVRGKRLDKRADIWAFGCVLYETLTGSRAFNRETVADTLAAILDADPDWDLLPKATPVSVRSLLQRCLQKNPKLRLRDIGDAWVEIETTLTGPMPAVSDVATVVVPAPLWRRALPWTVAGVAAALAASLGLWVLSPQVAPVNRVEITLQPGTRLWGGLRNAAYHTAFALTPDGRAVVYAATAGDSSKLYLRRLDEFEAIPITGTDGGSSPFVSPNGLDVGFVVGKEIRVVSINGGAHRRVLEDAPFEEDNPNGVSWTGDRIVFGAGRVIFGVPAGGGTPEQLTELRPDEDRHLHPQLLPGGTTLLYTVQRKELVWDTTEIVALPEGGEPVSLVSDGADARYSSTGHLVFARRGVLMAVRFDPEQLEELTGEEVEVVDDVMQTLGVGNTARDTGEAQFSISASGSLVYATGGIDPENKNLPVWMDREGNDAPFPVTGGNSVFEFARLSPDCTRVAYLTEVKRQDILNITVRDLDTGRFSSLDLDGKQSNPVWSPDGTRLAFASDHEGPDFAVYWVDAADLNPDNLHRVAENLAAPYITDWTHDEKIILAGGQGIWVLDVGGSSEPERLFDKPGQQAWPALSPDGRWLAYASEVDEQMEVFLRPYPAGNFDRQISIGGGAHPAWSRDGKELFYRGAVRSKMMAVQLSFDDDGFSLEGLHELFDRVTQRYVPARGYDVAKDGHFLMLIPGERPRQPVTQIRLILNWFEELNRLVPTGR